MIEDKLGDAKGSIESSLLSAVAADGPGGANTILRQAGIAPYP